MTNWQTGEDGNVFEMIAANGGPGLWIRRLTWGKTCARIVASGEFSDAPPYFGNPSVLMDVFTLDGELIDELAPVSVPGTFKTWRRWPEPAWAGKIALRSLDDSRIAEALYRLDKKRQKLPGMQHAPKTSDSFTRAEIKATCENVVAAFYGSFGRRPTPREQELIVSALVRFFSEPNAPSTRLH